MTNERELLELAAKALGLEVQYEHVGAADGYFIPKTGRAWNPLHDQADSDRMACALRMSTRVHIDCAFAMVEFPKLIDATAAHDNTDEDVCRAAREARIAVAAEIGRACK